MAKISHTAAFIGIKFYGLTKDARISQHFDPFLPSFYQNLVSHLPSHLSWYQSFLNSQWMRRFFMWTEELLLPGDIMHIICRKYYLDKMIKESLESGVEQLVILGSGFDHIGAYFSSKGTPCFELDRELMTKEKQFFLEKFEYQKTNLVLIPGDFEKGRLCEFLSSAATFDTSKTTLFIAEGFFDYLSVQSSREILEDIRELNPQNKLLTTFFSLDELNSFHRFSFTSGVSMVGESLKLPLNLSSFTTLLQKYGFIPGKKISFVDMEEGLVKETGLNLPVLNGFYILKTGN
ncbi:MAG: hypothetical protein ED557_03275 [Balneola sp.]|nr:MAG: hypothetical protein ED557_03275 [Balneola sp.]